MILLLPHMEQCQWESNSCSDTQEIPHLLRNPMVHYHFDVPLCPGDETRTCISLFIYRSSSLLASCTALRTLMYSYLFIVLFICLLTEERCSLVGMLFMYFMLISPQDSCKQWYIFRCHILDNSYITLHFIHVITQNVIWDFHGGVDENLSLVEYESVSAVKCYWYFIPIRTELYLRRPEST